MSQWYRYIRPVKFNERRVELETQPNGGVCLRFEEYNGALWFTHSRCPNNELFSKEVAKRISDARAEIVKLKKVHVLGYHGQLKLGQSTDDLIASVIDFCLNWELPPDAAEHVHRYMRAEHLELGSVLQKLIAQNAAEKQKSEIWKAGIAAAGHSSRYEQISNA
jgi:hypothetical protein